MNTTNLVELLKPHVEQIMIDAHKGDARAKEVIALYRLHRSCPHDPAAIALCVAAFDEWKEAHDETLPAT